jgi:hypothetical protein
MQTSDVHPSAVKEKPEWILTAQDRCDRCSAQAYVRIKGGTGDLMFCGHHYDKIMNDPNAYTKMMAFMLEVLDERERLNENRAKGDSY